MQAIIHAAGKSLQDLSTPGLIRIFLLSSIATLAIAIVLISGTFWVAGSMTFFEDQYARTAFAIGSSFISLMVAWMLFPIMLPLIVSFFDEKIADLIETHDYPHLKQPEYPFWPTFWQDVRFTLKALGLNIGIIGFMAVTIVLWPLIPFVFFVLNGYLLGEQFFRMAAIRRLGLVNANAMIRANRRVITLAGILITFLASVPFINLVSPFWGVAMMIHLFHRLRDQENVIVTPYYEVDNQ